MIQTTSLYNEKRLSSNKKKSRTRETKNLSTDVDSRTVTVSEMLQDLSLKEKKERKKYIFTPPPPLPAAATPAKGILGKKEQEKEKKKKGQFFEK